jgi:hypothetical protein
VRVGVGDSHVGPAVADVAAVQGLRLIRLGHRHSVVPSDLSDVVAEPDDLQPEDISQVGHGLTLWVPETTEQTWQETAIDQPSSRFGLGHSHSLRRASAGWILPIIQVVAALARTAMTTAVARASRITAQPAWALMSVR